MYNNRRNYMDKYKVLINKIKEYKKVAVAFSGGVDSVFLAKVAYDTLGKNAMAITVIANMHPKREINEAKKLAKQIGIEHILIDLSDLMIEGFEDNPLDRCYICKKEVFTRIKAAAELHAIDILVDGSNADDTGDYRPGMRAIEELGVHSPLLESDLTKKEIRQLSKELGLETFNKPSFSCLATRFPYGEKITDEGLALVEKSEDYLKQLGFIQFRVRVHGDIARIEFARDEREKLFDISVMDKVSQELKSYGFNFVAMELSGYKTGSMNIGI